MQVTKLRVANDNGLVPAGRYFAHLAEGFREANQRAAAIVDAFEEQEHKLEDRYRSKSALPVPAVGAQRIKVALN